MTKEFDNNKKLSNTQQTYSKKNYNGQYFCTLSQIKPIMATFHNKKTSQIKPLMVMFSQQKTYRKLNR